MNPFTNLQPGEQVLRKERIHAGIFVIPVLTLCAELVLALPLAFIFSIFNGMLKGLTPSNPPAAADFLVFLCVMVLLVPVLGVFLVTLLVYLKSEITLTNKRLMYSTGFLVREAGELPLQNVEAMFIQEPIIGRIFGFGTVLVSGVGGVRFPLRFIGKPHVFYAVLQRAVADAKASSRSVAHPVASIPD